MSGVKVAWSSFQLKDNDIRRQQIIQTPQQQLRRLANLPCHFDMRNLTERVNTGIGAACTLHVDVSVEDNHGGLSQLSHDGASVLLLLPAAVARAIVFEKQFKSDQGFDVKSKYSEARKSR